jgi:WhiB family transcriptional regulator, redox-sensing transcriptional regulator
MLRRLVNSVQYSPLPVDDDRFAGLARLLSGQDWRRDGLCAEPQYARSVEFFPERGQPVEPAKAVCARCTVSAECLAYALELGIREGVWGGTTGNDRRRIWSANRRAASPLLVLLRPRRRRVKHHIPGLRSLQRSGRAHGLRKVRPQWRTGRATARPVLRAWLRPGFDSDRAIFLSGTVYGLTAWALIWRLTRRTHGGGSDVQRTG